MSVVFIQTLTIEYKTTYYFLCKSKYNAKKLAVMGGKAAAKMKEIWFAVFKSSKDNQELYIPVVKVLTLKKETVPKSDKHSIDTSASPAIMAGLADGKTILKNVFFVDRPKFFPTSI